MATKVQPKAEKLLEIEVKRRRVRAGGGYEPFWKLKTVDEAVADGDTEFRCKECQGELKLHKRHVANGPASHAAHKVKSDGERCAAGVLLRANAEVLVPAAS